MSQPYHDHVVWITGAGSGIGRALALKLAAQGAHLALSGRRRDRLDEVAAEVQAAGAQAFVAPCDVAVEAEVHDACRALTERFGRLDVAIANAGCSVNGRVEEIPLDQWRRQLEINVLGAVATAQAALPELRRRRGRLALVGSVMSTLTLPGAGAYAASKFALRAVGLTLSQELHGSGTSCTLIYPGFVESEIAQVDNQGVYHAERADNRPAALMWSADAAADVMLPAIWRRRREFTFTAHGKLGVTLGLHAPSLVHAVATRSSAFSRPAKR